MMSYLELWSSSDASELKIAEGNGHTLCRQYDDGTESVGSIIKLPLLESWVGESLGPKGYQVSVFNLPSNTLQHTHA